MMAGEAVEAPVHTNIIDNNLPAGPQRSPRPIHFKANIAFTPQAVMNEKIHPAESRKCLGQASNYRAAVLSPEAAIKCPYTEVASYRQEVI
jgi:hypothetical protein